MKSGDGHGPLCEVIVLGVIELRYGQGSPARAGTEDRGKTSADSLAVDCITAHIILRIEASAAVECGMSLLHFQCVSCGGIACVHA